jgi:hypothetical protein
MSDIASTDHRQQCKRKCTKAFIEYTETKPVGGVEALRICRENCDGGDRKRLGSREDIETAIKDKHREKPDRDAIRQN